MSKAAASKSRSQSSHSRSRSRSFSRSRSRSSSRSHSRKRKYSPRSRSRSYSPAHARERHYPREHQPREFRGHRGYRRPFIQRRGRGYYPRGNWNNRGGYGNYGNYNHYGGYRPNWHNYRSTYSPRRGRSRSRSPKRRSGSPRSRSRSRYSDKSSSSGSRRSSSSRSHSSPRRSRSRSSKQRRRKSKKEATASQASPQAAEDQEKVSGEAKNDDGVVAVPGSLAAKRSDSWKGLIAYDTSPKQPSAAPRSTVVLKTSPALQQSPSMSGAGSRAEPHQSPQGHSPPPQITLHHSPPSPDPSLSPPLASAQKEEMHHGGLGLFMDQPVPTISSYLKSMAKMEFYVRNNAEKGSQSPKRFKSASTEEFEKLSKAEAQHKFGFEKEELEEQDKNYSAKSQRGYEYDEEPKFRTKVSLSAIKTQERYEEEEEEDENGRLCKRDELSYFTKHITVSNDKYRAVKEEEEEEIIPERFKKEERFLIKKGDVSRYRELSPENLVKASKYKEGRVESPPQRKGSDIKEREESPPVLTPVVPIYRPPEVTLKMDPVPFSTGILGSTNFLSHERRLSRDLVHKPKKDQEFRSIFQHIQMAQSRRSPSELFAQHIVTLVHHVKEHYFKSATVTLNERFTMYQRRTAQQEPPRQQSPEIHRRIDISPSSLKKHMHLHDGMKSPQDSSGKGEGKLREEPTDLRLDIERRRKYKGKEGDHKKDGSKVSRDSSHSRERSKEKSGKSSKSSRESKKQRKRKKARARSSSPSSSSSSSASHEGKEEGDEEREEREEGASVFNRARLGSKEFIGLPGRSRARGTFQFRIRGRGSGRGALPGPSNIGNPGNQTFPARPREEDWDPKYTPKSKKYYLHDDREGDRDNYWSGKRGRGTFLRGRGRFLYKKSSPSPKWTHDKYQGSGEEEEEEEEDGEVGNIANEDEKTPSTTEQ
ncbi:thyroid hormone receptor-associated protein 3 [Callorhinchus milii]|uniref:Thyroid hormone receptor associated protein 3 n=1 Tax=Callorhinchus milii TaxID=7868 RepID=A0A4W3IVA4_CALMI|nr:thyroid hormone receptor-associated protein 3 [Callorhinchus milii]|eukprot:gi/632976743/ref/XP_007904966.1/ PREDICTED: thyroid hormone receptor-associated protein 3 [Callorhinchus milii]